MKFTIRTHNTVIYVTTSKTLHDINRFARLQLRKMTNNYRPITLQPGLARGQEMVFGETPVGATCCYCQNKIVTRTEYVDGNMTYLVSAVICGVGCWLGCCLIPFYVDALKDVLHICPYCGSPVGKYNRLC